MRYSITFWPIRVLCLSCAKILHINTREHRNRGESRVQAELLESSNKQLSKLQTHSSIFNLQIQPSNFNSQTPIDFPVSNESNMPRQSRSGGGSRPSRPTVAPSRPAPQQTRPATTAAYPPARAAPAPAAPPAAAPAPVQAQPQASAGPGLFGQMASTAA